MMREIIHTILFGIGFVFCIFEVIQELRKNKKDSKKERTSYKVKYYSIWSVLYLYLVYIQWFD